MLAKVKKITGQSEPPSFLVQCIRCLPKPLSHKLGCSLRFTKKSREGFMCLTCTKTCTSAHGYTNLITHLPTNHPTYLEDASQAAKERNSLRLRVVDDNMRTIFRWREWVLPSTLGIVIDGSTFNGRHYISTSPSFCPLDVVVNLGVQRLFDLIAYTLSRYNKPYEAVNFMVTDNHSVNQYVGSREGALLMVDCASHRFHLAGSDYLTGYETLLTRIHALMTKLRNIKDRAILRRVTELSSLLRNGTRWSSTHAMAQRYTKLGLALKELK
ncbi:hypothetical protein PHYSODRAFT_510666 [Phytophthora sojae]|uniref:BED-type domain-containing protein n=1 Tax=Phytophthora sojae (strain P6497) TaxID=1094619 RepID=G4ZRV6_PHYSP|nr:hypothetical protein PHYSODRAFT_510666 [Phytophthora sojae]EGZ13993.1 hypothetical protein PHYSODRAFT_510666 [Phytophthora sojae]|eukprot:XP_009531422.1 hypothetical protein PHYSODRAFT_510666 [Phytophthora sojae]